MIVLYFLLPGVLGTIALVCTRQRWTLLGAFGVGYLGDRLATMARLATDLRPVRSLGVLDPVLWGLVGALLIALVARLLRPRLAKRWWKYRGWLTRPR